MSKFLVTYPDGSTEEVEQSDCETMEAFANTKFGNSAYADMGVKVEQINIDDPASVVEQVAEVGSDEVEQIADEGEQTFVCNV